MPRGSKGYCIPFFLFSASMPLNSPLRCSASEYNWLLYAAKTGSAIEGTSLGWLGCIEMAITTQFPLCNFTQHKSWKPLHLTGDKLFVETFSFLAFRIIPPLGFYCLVVSSDSVMIISQTLWPVATLFLTSQCFSPSAYKKRYSVSHISSNKSEMVSVFKVSHRPSFEPSFYTNLTGPLRWNIPHLRKNISSPNPLAPSLIPGKFFTPDLAWF